MKSLPVAVAVFTLSTLTPPVVGQDVSPTIRGEDYLQPAPHIVSAVLAPRHENVTVRNPSPDGTRFAVVTNDGPPTIAMFAKPFYRIAGLQVDPAANRARQLTTRSGVGIDVIGTAGTKTSVRIPDGARITSPVWSPDGTRLAYLAHTDRATHLYVADPNNGRSRQVNRTPLLATLVTTVVWTPDSRFVMAVTVPADRGAEPPTPRVPEGPQVRITTPETNRIRTYPDLLENRYEQRLLTYYTTGQLVVIDVERRRERTLGAPAMISDFDLAPDGASVRVEQRDGAFSYIVPQRQFGSIEQVWDVASGHVLATIDETALRDGSEADDDDDGDPERRNIHWRPDGALGFLQLAPQAEADTSDTDTTTTRPERNGRRDRVMRWAPPFTDSAISVVYENERRMSVVRYSPDGETLVITEQQGDRAHDFAIMLHNPEHKHTLFRGKRPTGFRATSNAPTVMTRTLPNGARVARLSADGHSVFMSGTIRDEDPMSTGPKTYIDRVAMHDGATTRVYESANDGVYEQVLAVLDNEVTQLVVSRESPTEVPDSYIRNLETGQLQQLTANTDFTPDITNAERRRYHIKRADGFEFAVNVTLPAGWTGEPLPAMFWFYPREYTGQDPYDETRERYNKNAFPRIGTRSMEILVRDGYAVVQPDAPIIGEDGRMNDNYVHDLRNNLSAVIDHLDGEGIIDRSRLGIGGHSYGAFGTVNAMVHTPFFKAGIAGDGNFNRTLTPFSFQSERRSLWESPHTYFEMSPIFQADHLSGALLMYHGEHDQNVGTFPINSWRLYESLEALGKTASLYVYPYEDHGPATRETLLDLWARWTAWLDTYVKKAGADAAVADISSGGAAR